MNSLGMFLAFIYSHRIRYGIAAITMLASVILGASELDAEDGLAGHAVIRRDTVGVPHILGETEEAAAYAYGFAVAEDHLEELARLFLRAQGAQASVFGQSFVESDLLVHRLGIPETAQSRFADLPPLMQSLLNAYAAGYDLYLSKHPPEAPPWARPISGIDVLAHCRAVLLLDFALDLRPWKQATFPAEAQGSNMWAIGRDRSKSHHGILLANPHLRWKGSQMFHEVHLRVPGVIDIYGATLLGFPVVTIGFNDYLGWAHTVNQHRSDAVYELTIDPADPTGYLYDGHHLPFSSRTVSIAVKTEQGVETQKVRILSSHYGPVISIRDRVAYAYKSANLDIVGFLTQYNQMAKARNLVEFRAALDMQQLPMFNIGYADQDGNIFFLSNARIPIQPSGYDWTKPVRGDTDKTEWYALYPVSELPQLLNPLGGYIQNCNDPPWYTNLQQPIDRKNFPAYLGYDGLGLRGQISLQMLENKTDFTLDGVKRSKYDETLLPAQRLKNELIHLASNKELNAEDAEIIRTLSAWDDTASAGEQGAVLFDRWLKEYLRSSKNPFRVDWDPKHPITTPSGIGDPEHALAALAQASAAVKRDFGSVSVRWGDVHRLHWGDVDVPIGGDSGALRTITYCNEGNRLIACGGDSFVLAVEFTSPPTAYSVMAYSESSNPRSKHYSDQALIFAREDYKPVWFTEQNISEHLEHAYHPGE